YFSHIKCALNAQKISASTPRNDPSTSAAGDDIHSLLHFPMSKTFTDPLRLVHSKITAQDDKETTEIDHWSHPAHPLILNVEDLQGNNMMPDINSGDPIKKTSIVIFVRRKWTPTCLSIIVRIADSGILFTLIALVKLITMRTYGMRARELGHIINIH
nr:C1-like protein [Tanacetum cinerariifolium]